MIYKYCKNCGQRMCITIDMMGDTVTWIPDTKRGRPKKEII